MAVQDQKAGTRPISFIFHNTSDGSPPIERKLVVRPDELTRTDVSRLTPHQTLGGAWADSFGEGLPQINISGTTGWGQGDLPNGQVEFEALHSLVYKLWHLERAFLVKNGKDPDLVKLIFHDVLDSFTWVVAPNNFVLKRSKSRPLLSMYQIGLTYLSSDVSETMKQLELSDIEKKQLALSSLDSVLKKITDFAKNISKAIQKFLGPLKDAIMKLVKITSTILNAVRTLINAGMMIVNTVTGIVMDIATGLSLAVSNIFATVTAVQSIPGQIMAQLVHIKTLFMGAYCVLKNTFKSRLTLDNYDDVYGASLCSSTAGGRPLSQYLEQNTFDSVSPIINNTIAMNSESLAAMKRLERMDSALAPYSLEKIGRLSDIVANGVVLI